MSQIIKPIRPSNVQRVMQCPASIHYAGEQMPESDSASQGTKLHNAVEKESIDGLTNDEIELVTPILEQINQWREDGFEILHEVELKHESIEGKADIVGINRQEKKVFVIDCKFGHRTVYADKNLQCMFYTALIFFSDLVTDDFKAIFGIYQPTLKREIDWAGEIFDSNIKKWYEDFNFMLVRDAYTLPRFEAGEHCRYCSHAQYCQTAQETVMSIKKTPLPLSEIPNDELSDLLEKCFTSDDIIKNVQTQIDAIKAEAILRFEKGENIYGYALKAGKQQRKIPQGKEREIEAFTGLSMDDFISCVTISASKLIKACALQNMQIGKNQKERERIIEQELIENDLLDVTYTKSTLTKLKETEIEDSQSENLSEL